MSYLNKYNNPTPTQHEKLDDRQVKNAAGGYVYGISAWDALNRFLILGTAGGSHYETERDLTKQNVDNIIKAIKEDGVRVVNTAHEVSFSGEGEAKRSSTLCAGVVLEARGHRDQARS